MMKSIFPSLLLTLNLSFLLAQFDQARITSISFSSRQIQCEDSLLGMPVMQIKLSLSAVKNQLAYTRTV